MTCKYRLCEQDPEDFTFVSLTILEYDLTEKKFNGKFHHLLRFTNLYSFGTYFFGQQPQKIVDKDKQLSF